MSAVDDRLAHLENSTGQIDHKLSGLIDDFKFQVTALEQKISDIEMTLERRTADLERRIDGLTHRADYG